MLEPVLSYQICLPEGCDVHKMLKNLKMLEEEEPELHIVWDEHLGEIHAKLMGEVQTEILKSLIKERFGVEISFGSGSMYTALFYVLLHCLRVVIGFHHYVSQAYKGIFDKKKELVYIR